MRDIVFILLLLGMSPSAAQKTADQDTDEKTDKNTEKTQATEQERRPEVFNPTEQLSEDKDISFPTDI